MERRGQDYLSFATLAGGLLALLSALHFMEKLSFALGAYYGVLQAVKIYNVTPTQALYSVLSQSTAVTLALYFTFLMLPFALLAFAVGALWLFSKSYLRLTTIVLILSSLVLIAATAWLEFNINFNFLLYAISYVGGALSLVSGIYAFTTISKKPASARAAGPITIDPNTPYTNALVLSRRLMSRLSGELKVLDMHFDALGLENLSRLLGDDLSRYSSIRVLAKRDRLGSGFFRVYSDFRSELANKNVNFELKVMRDEDAIAQHERILMDGKSAYKIPPLNIINKRSEHIVSINYREAENRFAELWQTATKLENLKEGQLP